MMSQEDAARKEILERVRHKHQRPEFLVLNICNKLGAERDLVQGVLDRLLAEGAIQNEDVHGIPMVSIVRK
jgi:hypothetical protein